MRDLEVGGVVAALARDERVFARARRREVVERLAAAHHPGLRLDADDVEPAALEDPLIGPRVRTERNIEPFLVPVERVGVLHHELAHPQEAAARPGLVPPFRLEVVEDLRQVAVRAQLARVERDGLLVRQGEHERALGAIGQPEELGDPDASRHLPQLAGVDDGHRHLLAPDRVHLLADDPDDLRVHAPPGR